MLRFLSLVTLTDERRQPLTVGADGGFEPAKDRAAATLKLVDARTPDNGAAVAYGALVLFEVSVRDGRSLRVVQRRSDPWIIQGSDGAAKGDVPAAGRVALFPTRRRVGSASRVRDAIVVTIRTTSPAPPEVQDGASDDGGGASDTGGTGGTGTNTGGTGGTGTDTGGTGTNTGTTNTSTGTGGSAGGGEDDVPFIGEIRMFAGNFAPRGWALCDGQLLPISSNTALFSVLGTTYGGNGTTTFGLPDLRGRFAMHAGTGPGLTPRSLGSSGGAEAHTQTQPELSNHAHSLQGLTVSDRLPAPDSPVAGEGAPGRLVVSSAGQAPAPIAVGASGGNIAQPNLPPYRTVNYIIATEGIYPARA